MSNLSELLHHEIDLRWLVPNLHTLSAQDVADHPLRGWIIDALIFTASEHKDAMRMNFDSTLRLLDGMERDGEVIADLKEQVVELERICDEWAEESIDHRCDPWRGRSQVPGISNQPCVTHVMGRD